MKNWDKLSAAAIISSLGVIVYSNTFFSSFHYDDEFCIVNNFAIKNIHDLLNIWNFYPCRFITFLSLSDNYYFHQLNVLGYHLINLAVHLVSAILVWWLVLLTFSTPAMKGNKIIQHANGIALFAGLIFVSHPIQTEAVTYICQRAVCMATLFYLASLCFYIQSRLIQEDKPGGDQGKFYYIFSLVTAIVAMFTKEITITLPLMFLVYEFCFFKGKGSPRWKCLAPFLLAIGTIPLTMLLTKSKNFQDIHTVITGVGYGGEGVSPVHYLLTQFRVMITYIRLVFLPCHQNLDYDYPVYKSIFEPAVFISLSILIVILFGAKKLFSKYRVVSFSIFWFFLTLLPESSILPAKDVIFEHRLYLPLVGYSIFLASGAYYSRSFVSPRMTIMALVLFIACYSVLTYQRNMVWKNDITLWNDTVGKSPHKARAYLNRGFAYFKQGNLDQSIADLSESIAINPDIPEAYISRGTAYEKEGKFIDALNDYTKAIKIFPNEALAYHNRALLFKNHGFFPQAITDATKLIEIDPRWGYAIRGLILTEKGNYTQAISDFNKSIEIDPYDPEMHTCLGVAYGKQGNLNQAISEIKKAYELNPNYNLVCNNKAYVISLLDKYDMPLRSQR